MLNTQILALLVGRKDYFTLRQTCANKTLLQKKISMEQEMVHIIIDREGIKLKLVQNSKRNGMKLQDL